VIISSFRDEYAFLSNFYPSPLRTYIPDPSFPEDPFGTLVLVEFPTAEHYFQSQKTENLEEIQKIAAAPSPGDAKRLGRTVTLRDDWESRKFLAMKEAVGAKFRPGSDLAEKLIGTGEAYLLEGNTWGDYTWGAVPSGNRWLGDNWLGTILMARRAELRYLGEDKK
jgi:ribA/ribD-fused uncharacterized protein